jgi:GNAT superfamily N-acetyltransferase
MITFPNKVYSEAEVIQLYEESYSKWKNKNKTNGKLLSKTRKPRAQQPLFPPLSKKTPDGYYVALDGDILAAWAGWRAVDENLYLTAGSFTAPDYRGQGIQTKLWVKRNSMFAGKSVITITNKKEQGWRNIRQKDGKYRNLPVLRI